jgi:hypothetical protein
MKKLALACIGALITMSVFIMPALAGEKVVKRVPAGAAAFHFVADLTIATGELVGYIAFIEGVDGDPDGDLFAGPPSEDTAYFTVRLTKLTPPPIFLPVDTGSGLFVLLIPPGAEATVFFDDTPGPRDWSDPDTFSQGLAIAVLEESALLNTTSGGAAFNVFSSRLIDSAPIDFYGQRIDFKKLVPNGVTITNFASPRAGGGSFGATAFAIGGNLRDK